MSDFKLTRRRIRGGYYEGLLTTNARLKDSPVIELHLPDTSLGDVSITATGKGGKSWDVIAKIPSVSINEGIQTYILRDGISGDTLDSFAVVTGEPLQEDLRSEIALMRAELDMLKRSFRRHVVESSG